MCAREHPGKPPQRPLRAGLFECTADGHSRLDVIDTRVRRHRAQKLLEFRGGRGVVEMLGQRNRAVASL
jgi:hypothetical protein